MQTRTSRESGILEFGLYAHHTDWPYPDLLADQGGLLGLDNWVRNLDLVYDRQAHGQLV